jgi:general secretion pathway protein D
VKTIYSLFLVLLFTSLVRAQTTPPAPTTVPRRTVPTRGGASPATTAPPSFPRFPRAAVPTNRVNTATNSAAASAVPARPIVSTTNAAATAATTTTPTPTAPTSVPGVSTASGTTAVANASNGTNEVANIHYDFQKMPLEQILDIYSALAGRTILEGAGLNLTLPITLRTQGDLTKSEAITALETVLAMNGVTFIPIGDKFAKVVIEAQAPQAGGKFSDETADELPEAGKYVTQIVQLKYAEGQEVVGALQPFAKSPASIILMPTSNTLILRDYSENIKRMLEVIKKVDIVTPLAVKPEVIPIKYALSSDIAQVLGSLTASGPGVQVGSRSTRGAGVTPGGYQPGTTGGTGFGSQLNNNNSSFQQPGQTGSPFGSSATSSRGSFQRNLQNIVSRISASAGGDIQVLGNAKIIDDDRTNSLLIFANDQDMVMIKTIISQLDVVLAQVLIEAVIMEVSLDNSTQLGISYLQQPKQVGSFTGAGGVNNGQAFLNPRSFTTSSNSTPVAIQDLTSGFSYFGSFGKDLDVALAAFANDSRVNVLSCPRIQTSHAVPATLFIGDTVPYITGTSSYLNINGGTSSTYQEKRVGITLDVLPLINPDGLVVMDIQQNIQQLGTPVTIDGNQVPTTTERDATAKVAVRDGDTIILGGFISTSKTTGKSGVPYLKDIPLLGALFRSSNDSTHRVELIVLLRPKVLPTPEVASIVAATERDKLSGVRQGEFEIHEMERKRQEAIDNEMRKKLGIRERPL